MLLKSIKIRIRCLDIVRCTYVDGHRNSCREDDNSTLYKLSGGTQFSKSLTVRQGRGSKSLGNTVSTEGVLDTPKNNADVVDTNL